MGKEESKTVEMKKVSVKDVMQVIDAWIEQMEKLGIKPAGGNIPLNVEYKGYRLGIYLEAVDQENTTKVR